MNIALLGYGKMGKEIEAIALQRGHSIVLKVDKSNASSFTNEELKKADVAIEFSTPHTVITNIKKCFDAQVPIVVGTTGWYDSTAGAGATIVYKQFADTAPYTGNYIQHSIAKGASSDTLVITSLWQNTDSDAITGGTAPTGATPGTAPKVGPTA